MEREEMAGREITSREITSREITSREMAGREISGKLVMALGSVVKLLSCVELETQSVWLLGGSCGLLLHSVPLRAEPRDIDIYAGLQAAGSLHEALSTHTVNEPLEDWSGGCYSLLSRYRIGGASVELVCGFQINCGRSRYTVNISELLRYAPVHYFPGIGRITLMPVAHEFLFNVLRGRVDRYEDIAAVMRSNLPEHLPLLQSLIAHNNLEISLVQRLEELLGIHLLQEPRKEVTS